jgi:riboflavin kinase/FMN adenylyltransferase
VSSAVAIGVFDGLHLGHQAILERALQRSRTGPVRTVVLSFDPHPDVVLGRGAFHAPAPLTPIPEKRARLRAMGVHQLEILPFTRELAALEPETFIDRHVMPHRPISLVMGQDFALGRGRSGHVERLRAIGATSGFEVEAVPLLELDGAPVSSSRIRALLGEGRVAAAARLLGRRYDLAGTVVTGHGVGRTLGVPTANLRLHHEKMLPADGVYAAWVHLPRDAEPHAAAVSIGMRPTFEGTVRVLEAHLLDWHGELVGVEIQVEFVDWVRPQQKFAGAEALTAAMAADVAQVQRILTAAEPPRQGVREGVS